MTTPLNVTSGGSVFGVHRHWRLGWRDVVDLGDRTACRAMEQLAPIWICLNEKFGHVYFDLAVVRREEK